MSITFFSFSCLYLVFILAASCSILNFWFFVTHLFLEIGVNNLGVCWVLLWSPSGSMYYFRKSSTCRFGELCDSSYTFLCYYLFIF